MGFPVNFLARWFRHEIEMLEDLKLWWSDRRDRKSLPPTVPYTHPKYGTFKGAEFRNMHTDVEVVWLGRPVDFQVESTFATPKKGSEVVPESFEVMDTLMADQSGWMEKARAVIIRDLYPLWRDEWRDPEVDPMLNEEEFWERIDLETIATGGEGYISFLFAARDEMFSDHSIDAYGNLETGFEDAELFG